MFRRIKPFDAKKEGRKLGRKYSDKQILIFSVIGLVLLTIIISTTYAIFTSSDRRNIIDSEVGPFNAGDIRVVIYVDGKREDEFPAKDSGKRFEKIECNNSGEASWDRVNWELEIKDIIGKTTCNVYFSSTAKYLNDTIIVNNGGISNILAKGVPNFNVEILNETPVNGGGLFVTNGTTLPHDEDGPSYYFRGTHTGSNIVNNNLIFGGFQWKIIRINGDGSIRLIYNGKCSNNECIIN